LFVCSVAAVTEHNRLADVRTSIGKLREGVKSFSQAATGDLKELSLRELSDNRRKNAGDDAGSEHIPISIYHNSYDHIGYGNHDMF
jgi:hypothetical protein